jgi:hypothetical protein
MKDTPWDSYSDDDGALWWRLRCLWGEDGALLEDGEQSKREEFIGSHCMQLREGRRNGECGEATDLSMIRVKSVR